MLTPAANRLRSTMRLSAKAKAANLMRASAAHAEQQKRLIEALQGQKATLENDNTAMRRELSDAKSLAERRAQDITLFRPKSLN